MLEYLKQTIDWIDAHPLAADRLDRIAAYIGFSPSYLNHLFSICTGESILAYARRRRLEYGLEAMVKGEIRILDVGLELGYSSDRAFSRAVTEEFGQPSSYYRINQVLRKPKLTARDLSLHLDGDRLLADLPLGFEEVRSAINRKGMKAMKEYLSDVRYENLPPMTVISGTAVGTEPEDEISARLGRLARTYDLTVDRVFGFDVPLEDPSSLKDRRGYEAWLAVSEDQLARLPDPAGFEFEGTPIRIRRIPACCYAILRINDPFAAPFERIPAGWRSLVQWLEDQPQSDSALRECPDAQRLEEVRHIDGIQVMDLFIPVGAF